MISVIRDIFMFLITVIGALSVSVSVVVSFSVTLLLEMFNRIPTDIEKAIAMTKCM